MCRHAAAALLRVLRIASPAGSPVASLRQLCIEDRPAGSAADGQGEASRQHEGRNLLAAMRALRIAEFEIIDLRADLDAARLSEEVCRRAHSAPANALGWVIAVTDAPGTLERWIQPPSLIATSMLSSLPTAST